MSNTSVPAKIRKQVEFYFSDSNLPYDKYLWTLHKFNEGWIPISTIANFKKMKMISEDFDTVVAALKEAFEVEKATEDNIADLLNLQDDIQEFFEQFGTVLCVRMRKEQKPKGEFKGSVFVEFSTPEEAEKVAAMDLEYKGKKLELLTKKAYVEKKAEQYKGKEKPQYKKFGFNAFRAHGNEHRSNRKQPFKHNDKKSANDDKKTGEKRELETGDDENENENKD
ncbi:unnamed protein product [Cunninghamella echinulata]